MIRLAPDPRFSAADLTAQSSPRVADCNHTGYVEDNGRLGMATLHVRNVPDELYERLKSLAEEDHRSLSAEVIDLLQEAAVAGSRRSRTLAALDVLHRIALENGPQPEGLAAELIREGRDESERDL
jgi:plasmid stability protein